MSEVKSTYNVIAKILNNFTGHGGWGGGGGGGWGG